MPDTPAGLHHGGAAAPDDDLAELAALALVASGNAPTDTRDAALVSAGEILMRRPDLSQEWRDLQATTSQLEVLLRDDAAPSGRDAASGRAPGDPIEPPLPDLASARRRRRPQWAPLAAAAATLTIAAAGVGFLTGRESAEVAAAPTVVTTAPAVVVTAQPATSTVPGTVVRSAVDAGTGARLAVRVVPAAGWVRLEATVEGVAAGRRCRLVAVPRSGEPVLAGSWLVSAKGAAEGTGLNGTALIAPADLAGVRVEDESGEVLVDARI